MYSNINENTPSLHILYITEFLLLYPTYSIVTVAKPVLTVVETVSPCFMSIISASTGVTSVPEEVWAHASVKVTAPKFASATSSPFTEKSSTIHSASAWQSAADAEGAVSDADTAD
jgi:hypothetical protein